MDGKKALKEMLSERVWEAGEVQLMCIRTKTPSKD
jgi:hypothetical protein